MCPINELFVSLPPELPAWRHSDLAATFKPQSAIEIARRFRGADTSGFLEKSRVSAAQTERTIGAFVSGSMIEEIGARQPVGQLSGLPYAVKDNIGTGMFETGVGFSSSVRLRNEDADIVELLSSCGAVLFGKTAMAEFALYTPSRTRNPLDLSRSPGGSSGGSAAAVASGQVAFAVGTQTAGSVIRPAAFCGVAAISLSQQHVPLNGIYPLAPSLDTLGIFAATPRDLGYVVRAISEGSPKSSSATLKRIAVCERWNDITLSKEIERRFRNAILTLQSGEIAVVPVKISSWLENGHRAHDVIMGFEAFQSFRRLPNSLQERASARLVEYVRRSEKILPADYQEALRTANDARTASSELLCTFDALVTPSTHDFAPAFHLGTTGTSIMNRLWTLLQAPAVNVPVWERSSPLPVGLQIVGRNREDLALIGQAIEIEQLLEIETETVDAS